MGKARTKQPVLTHKNVLIMNNYVSLGGWGGYIVVGFDHSIENKGGYDFPSKEMPLIRQMNRALYG